MHVVLRTRLRIWNIGTTFADDVVRVRVIDGRALRFGRYGCQLIIGSKCKGVSVAGFTSRIEALGLAQSGERAGVGPT